jgi:predicted Zn finger-like uncharacterized protein
MALHVTQCPSCESSFNTSAAMLNLAEGKVRCGACLTVFHAVDNFLEPDPIDDAQDSDSVFVGNNPLDYFDPSSFLTRSALQEEADEFEGSDEEGDSAAEHSAQDAIGQDQTDFSDTTNLTDPPIAEESIELSEEYTREFFSSIEQTMEESLKQAESEKDLLLEQLQESETSFFEDLQTPLIADGEPLDAELFPDSSHELVDPFEPKKPEIEEDAAQQDGENDVFELGAKTPEENSNSQQAEIGATHTDAPRDIPAHTITETQAPPASHDLFPESIPAQSDSELPPMDEFVAQSITEIVSPEASANEISDNEAVDNPVAEEIPDEGFESEKEEKEETEGNALNNDELPQSEYYRQPEVTEETDKQTDQVANDSAEKNGSESPNEANWQSSSAKSASNPEDMRLSVSFSLQPGPAQRRRPDEIQSNTAANEPPSPQSQETPRDDLDELRQETRVETETEAEQFEEPSEISTEQFSPVNDSLDSTTEDLQEKNSESNLATQTAASVAGEENSPAKNETDSEIEAESSTTAEAELLEQELNREIAEHDFKESVADGFNSGESEFETAVIDSTATSTSANENLTDDTDQPPADEQDLSAVDENTEDSNEHTETEQAIEDNTEVIRARALDAQLEDNSALESIPQESIAALDVTSTPVELLSGKQSRVGRFIGFGALILLLGISLSTQHLWRNRIAYSQDDRFRSFIESACTFAACDIPVYSDISAIRSDNLTVRSHPSLENGLSVNIEFRNTAEYPQAFPVMVLSFNSANNDIVALREFAPSEYLSPGLRDIALMPSMSPVQVNLDVIDPGPGAVNYTLAFRLP